MSLIINPFVFVTAGGGGATITLTIASGTVASNLTNFPVLVDLSHMPVGFWSGVNADGGNIRVKQAGAVIPFWVAMIDTGAETGRVLFLAPTLNSGSDNVFTIELDGSGLLAATDPNGRNAVWADYEIVVGFDETTTDATGTSRTVTGNHVAGPDVPGFFKFVNSADLRTWDGIPTSIAEYTVSAGYYLAVTGASHRMIAAYTNDAATARHSMLVRGSAPIGLAIWNSSDGWLHPGGNGSAATTLYRGAFTSDVGGNRILYFNGSQIGTDPQAQGAILAGLFRIGATHSGNEALAPGEVGFAYLRPEIMSADWLAAEHESWHSPSTFYAVS